MKNETKETNNQSSLYLRNIFYKHLVITRCSDCVPRRFDYEPAEQFDENEPEDFINPEDLEAAEGEAEGYGEDDYAPAANEERVVVSGDPNAGYAGKIMEQASSKKVANEDRTTTPYMTKYEKARILGTRALQIRCVAHSLTYCTTKWAVG